MRGALERLLSAPEPLDRVQGRAGDGEPQWLQANGWRVFARPWTGEMPRGTVIERFATASGGEVAAVHDEDAGRVVVPFDLDEAYRAYVAEEWTGRASTRSLPPAALNVFYRVKRAIPRGAQLMARRALIRWQGLPEFPAWPRDDSVGELLRFHVRCALAAAGRDELRFRWFWPEGKRGALILTHDVEGEDGLREAIRVADLEEERGLRSSFNVVAQWYPVDHGILRELRGRGFEIGVHGVFHDRSMFSSRESFDEQRPAVEQAARDFEAVGFRSPATHRVHDWLGDLPVRYDCSVPMSDPYEPQPGGCCSLWPFFIGDVVELPYTLPQDYTLFTLLRHDSPRLWIEQAEAIERVGGLVQCLSHPDPGYLADADKRAKYAEFLDFAAGRDGLWKTLPREVASWWRERDAGGGAESRVTEGVARLHGRVVTLEPAEAAPA